MARATASFSGAWLLRLAGGIRSAVTDTDVYAIILSPDPDSPPVLRASALPLYTLAFALPLVPVFTNKAMVPLLVIVGLWAAVVLYRGGISPRARLTWFAVPSGLFLIYGGLSALWAPDSGESVTAVLRIAVLFALGHVLLALAAAEERPMAGLGQALWIGIAVACGIITTETLTGGLIVPELRNHGPHLPEYLFNHAAAVLSIVGWVAVLVVRARAGLLWAAALAAFVLATVSLSGSDSALVALVFGIASLPAFLWGGRPARRVGMVVIAGAMLAMPLVVWQMANRPVVDNAISRAAFSAGHRLTIWNYAAGKIAQRPLFGWGLESSRLLEREDASPIAKGKAQLPRLPLHPHNGPLQIWLELGLVGALFLVYFVGRLFVAVERSPLDEAEKASFCAMIVTAAVVASLTYGIWQNWWVSSFWIIAALARASLPLLGNSLRAGAA